MRVQRMLRASTWAGSCRSLASLALASIGGIGVLLSNVVPTAAEGMLWTDKPVRINPQIQTFERLPPVTGTSAQAREQALQIGPNIKVIDAANFFSNGRSYRIVDMRGLAANEICRDAQGKRWACGVRSRARLRSILTERFRTRCYLEEEQNDPVPIRCFYGGRPLADILIAQELAKPINQ